jgi:hypothetical protein
MQNATLRLPLRLLILLLLALRVTAQPQTYPGLVRQPTTSLAAYCTPGAEARTAVMAARCAAAIAWLKSPSQFGFAPSVTLLVLGPADWPRYAAPGEPYGMPHTSASNTLVVAAGSNAVWENTLPPVASLPPATAEALATIYRNAQGQLSLPARARPPLLSAGQAKPPTLLARGVFCQLAAAQLYRHPRTNPATSAGSVPPDGSRWH